MWSALPASWHAPGFRSERCDLYIRSEVPAGSGLSSSASVEVATALRVAWVGANMERLEIAQLGQRAESQFVGYALRHHGPVRVCIRPGGCGNTDRLPQLGARVRHTCRTSVSVVAVNSMVKHELGTSAYRERVAECQEAVEAIQAARIRRCKACAM